jgi:hypothetical protein
MKLNFFLIKEYENWQRVHGQNQTFVHQRS